MKDQDPRAPMADLPEPPEYSLFLAPYPEATQNLARAARAKLLQILPPVVEILYDATNAVTTGYGFTDKPRDHFIHLPVYTRYLNLGFNQGDTLDDPHGLLSGEGLHVRHIRLETIDLLDSPTVRGLIEQAIAQAPRPETPVEPHTIVRTMSGPKRRPSP